MEKDGAKVAEKKKKGGGRGKETQKKKTGGGRANQTKKKNRALIL